MELIVVYSILITLYIVVIAVSLTLRQRNLRINTGYVPHPHYISDQYIALIPKVNTTLDKNQRNIETEKIIAKKSKKITTDEIRLCAYFFAKDDNFEKNPNDYWFNAENTLRNKNAT
jgi:hypothetical protein